MFAIVFVVAVKFAVVALAATVTDVGTVKVVFVFVTLTTAPPVGAACVKLTVQVLEELGPRLVGLQDKLETSTDATKLIVAFAELLL